MAYVNLIATGTVFNIRASSCHIGLMMAFSEHPRWIISVFDRRSIMNQLYWLNQQAICMGTKRCHCCCRRSDHDDFCPCAEPLGDGHEGMWARFGSQGSIALRWHSRYSGTRYSGTWLYYVIFSSYSYWTCGLLQGLLRRSGHAVHWSASATDVLPRPDDTISSVVVVHPCRPAASSHATTGPAMPQRDWTTSQSDIGPLPATSETPLQSYAPWQFPPGRPFLCHRHIGHTMSRPYRPCRMPSCNRSITCLVSLHLSRSWAPLSLRTWVPLRCGSQIPRSTERLGLRPVQNGQEIQDEELIRRSSYWAWRRTFSEATTPDQRVILHGTLQNGVEQGVGAPAAGTLAPLQTVGVAWTLTSTQPPPHLRPITSNGHHLPPCIGVVAGTVLRTLRGTPHPLDAGESRSLFHRARSPYPRDRPTSYRSRRSPRGCCLSSRPSRMPPYRTLHNSRSRTPSPVGPSVFVPGPSPWVRPVSCQDPRLLLDFTGHGGLLPVDPVPVPQIVDVADTDTQLTSVYYSSVPNLRDVLSRIETLLWIYQNWILLWHPLWLRVPLPLRTFRSSSKILINPQSWPIIPTQDNNSQLVPIQHTSSTGPPLAVSDELETHGFFQNYRSFHRMSGDPDREARVSAYKDLMTLAFPNFWG